MIRLVGLLLLVSTLVGCAAPLPPQLTGNCFGDDASIERAVRIASCNELLGRERLTVQQLTSVYYARGRHQNELGNRQAALDDMSEVIRLNPNNWLYWNDRGYTYRLANMNEAAIADFDRAIQLAGQSAGPNFHILVNRAASKTLIRNFDGALVDINSAIQISPQDSRALFSRGIIHTEMRNVDAALADLDAAIRINPQLFEAYYRRALLRIEMRNSDAALADLDAAIRINPQLAAAYHRRALLRSDKLDDEMALADLNEAIRLNPRFASAYYSRGLVRAYLGNLDLALADFDEAVRITPTFANALANRVLVRRAMGRSIAIDADMAAALAAAQPRNGWPHAARAGLRLRGNDLVGAQRDLDESLTRDPDNPFAIAVRGVLHARRGALASARDDWATAQRLYPPIAVRLPIAFGPTFTPP